MWAEIGWVISYDFHLEHLQLEVITCEECINQGEFIRVGNGGEECLGDAILGGYDQTMLHKTMCLEGS